MNGKVMSYKVKRALLIGMAMGLAIFITGCDDVDIGDEAYEIIQDTQNTIQEVGSDIKDAVNDSDILSAPTGIEQDTGGLAPILEGIINDNCD